MSKIEGQIKSHNTRRFVIQYNQDELDSISPDNIRDWGEYIPIGKEMERLESRINKGTTPYIIYGVKGTGKTLMIHRVAKKLGFGLVEVICGDNVKERHLFGSPQIDLNGSYWNAGKIAVAFKALKIYKKVILFFDDITNLPPEIQLQLLSLCDKRKSIQIAGQTFHVEDDETLMIIATANPNVYAGVNPLTQALLSRFIGEVRPNPKADEIKKILDWGEIPLETVIDPLLTLTANTHDLVEQDDIEYELSPRDLDQFIEMYKDNETKYITTPIGSDSGSEWRENIVSCIQTCILVKYCGDPTEYEAMRIRCEETFGVDIR